MLFASELLVATSSVNYVIYPQTYDSTKYSLGDLIIPHSGSSIIDNWIGPIPMGVARPQEQSTVIAGSQPWAVQFITASVGNPGLDWVFLTEAAATSLTRKIVMYEYDRSTSNFAWNGFCTLNFPANPLAVQTTYLPKGFRMTRTLYNTGTVNVIGTYVTGSATAWKTAGMASGARIGFGSTDPAQIIPSNWYDISNILNDTLLQMSQSVAPYASGTLYVIEELRAMHAVVAANAASGGLYLTKGLSFNTFTVGGVAIPSASTVDGIRATYYLSDAPFPNITAVQTPTGVGIETMSADYTTHNAYVINGGGTANAQIFKYNLRAPLTGTLTAGRSNAAYILSTSLQGVTNTIGAAANNQNNGRIGILNHGPMAGTASLYFTTLKTILGCPLSAITTGSTNFVQYTMTEVPPGGAIAGTGIVYPVTSKLNAVEISEKMDKLIVTTDGSTSFRVYVTSYYADPHTMENIIFSDNKQQDQASSVGIAPAYPSVNIFPFSVWTEGGMTYLVKGNTAPAAINNQLYAIPLAAHYEYAAYSNESLITPAISTPSATKYYRVYANMMKQVGSDALGFSPEAYKIYVRTAGITDNTGAWTLVNDSGTLTGQSPADMIQFKIEFKTLGITGITNKFYGLTVTYEAGGYLPSQLQWVLSDSNTTDGTIGFSQVSLFGLVPNLQIDYYRSDNNANVLSQASTSTTNGTFQYWTGASWTAGVGTDTVGLRRRFVPSSGLPTGVNVYAKITTF